MKIYEIKNGMSFKQVVDVLGIEPYDIYHVQETGASLMSFNYRVKKRSIKIPNTLNWDEYDRQTTNEDSQKKGDLYYDKHYRTLYVLFSKEGSVTSFVTSSGIEKSDKILLTDNTIRFYDVHNTTVIDSAYNKAYNIYYNSKPLLIDVPQNHDLHHKAGLFRLFHHSTEN